MQQNKLNILVVEDVTILHESLEKILQKHNFNTFFAKNGREALKIYKKNKFEIILTDVNMPEMSGIEFCNAIKTQNAKQKIIILTQHIDRATILQILDLNINAIVSKIFADKDLFKAIENVQKNQAFYSGDILRLKNNLQNTQKIFNLTKRERFLLPYFCKGLTNKKIKQELENLPEKIFLSVHTIETHKKNIYLKLDVHNAAELAAKAKKLGFLY